MRQLLYISTARKLVGPAELQKILTTSRRNNRRDRLSGLLWSDGKRFLQVLEGEHSAIEATLRRIKEDDRHQAVVILHDRSIEEANFGDWSMASTGDEDDRISVALATADPVVRGTFEGLIAVRRAA